MGNTMQSMNIVNQFDKDLNNVVSAYNTKKK